MIRSDYRYAIDFYANDRAQPRTHLGLVAFDPDFEPAVESAVLAGLRCGALMPDARIEAALLTPVWAERGAPFVDAFEVRLESEGSAPFVQTIPRNWLRSAARTASATMIERGLLAAGDLFRHEVCAFDAAPAAKSGAAGGASARGDGVACDAALRTPALAPQRYDLIETLRDAGALDDPDVRDPALVIPAGVIEQTREAARRAGNSETGGILIGRICRSADPGDIVVEVTAQVPAAHSVATETRFTFTPETWAAASDAIALRRRNEKMVGWWHFHGWFCRKCSKQAQESCVYSRPFFSEEDVHLHRTVFGRATNVALLVSDFGPRGQEVAVYGWRDAEVVRRGYYATAPATARIAAPAVYDGDQAGGDPRVAAGDDSGPAAHHDHHDRHDKARAQGEPTDVCTQNP